MENQTNPYSQYLFYLLGQMMKGGITAGSLPASDTAQNTQPPAPENTQALHHAEESQAQRCVENTQTQRSAENAGDIRRSEGSAKDGENRESRASGVSGENRESGKIYFTGDETACSWRREERVDLLEKFCREGYFMAKKHGHFLLGKSQQGDFIAIPGRFLLEEQPAGGVTGFTLWQPLAGGEGLYEDLETMDEEAARTVYGYWVARLNPVNLTISEV